ncbi:lycopene cyclase domain-containing protein [Pedobacter montanisoli]|uniref:Lycopene cyclase domain-containing protein n=1 Tax=Pedobacter montanisoli TaxID=2923277 RepID=A0ABS9ZUD1_9SPHI|nr:lycopene cyclase domain-containing protein [Pedobacter montanisoli]MCJ0742210.1 lycopene cyclase domain-containing protein [Pedobacter montanisoli]
MKFYFLFIGLVALIFPVLFLADKKVTFKGLRKPVLWASVAAFVPYSLLTVFFVSAGSWVYEDQYLIKIFVLHVPVEHYLLNFALCFSGAMVYSYVNQKFNNNNLQKYSLAFSNLLLGVCVAFIFFAHKYSFTLIAFSLMLLILFLVEYVGKQRFMYKFYRSFLLMLVPAIAVFGLLKMLPIVKYPYSDALKVAIFGGATENIVLFFAMFLICIYTYEAVKHKKELNG